MNEAIVHNGFIERVVTGHHYLIPELGSAVPVVGVLAALPSGRCRETLAEHA